MSPLAPPHQSLKEFVVEAASSNSTPVGSGLIGLGPNFGSQIFASLNDDSGVTPLDNIFKQNTSTPNYLTILLQRDDDPGNVFPGELTVGELVEGYENITSQPKLNVTQVSVTDRGDQHWQILLDDDGVIGPNGKPIDIDTDVKQTSNKGQLTAVLDSGFSLPQVPKCVHDSVGEGFVLTSRPGRWRKRFTVTRRTQISSPTLSWARSTRSHAI